MGREKELAELVEAAGRSRLVTITGTGGCGKTRLALELAARLQPGWADGAWLVSLAPVSDPGLVPQRLASALGIRERSQQSLIEALASELETRRLLLVLDNCEHVVEACAHLVDELLRRAHGLQILATSREILRCKGELAYRLGPLRLPGRDPARSPSEVLESEAVALFLERARFSAPDLELDADDLAVLAEICAELDGIPLAIELAARWARFLSLHEIQARLSNRFQLLRTGTRTDEDRHRSLRAAIDWSYALLGDAERTVFRRLSTLPAGFTLEAATAVCAWGEVGEPEMLELLAALDTKSMLVPDRTVGGRTRRRQLESLRLYAREQLELCGEAGAAEERLVGWLATLVEPPAGALRTSAEWNQIGEEHDNLLHALRCAIAVGDPRQTVLAVALAVCWRRHGQLMGGHELLEAPLAHPGAPDHHRREADLIRAWIAMSRGGIVEALKLASAAVEASRRLGEWGTVLRGLSALGQIQLEVGDLGSVRACTREAKEISEAHLDPVQRPLTLTSVARMLMITGDLEEAESILREARCYKLGDPRDLSGVACAAGGLALAGGKVAAAEASFSDALRHVLGADFGLATMALEGLAIVAGLKGLHKRALLLLGGSRGMRELSPVHGWWSCHLEELERACRKQLGQARAASILAAGRRLTAERLLALALDPDQAPTEDLTASELTERERQISSLVARGLSNRAIAHRLGVSPRTVETHLRHVRRKLRVTTRTEVAVRTVRGWEMRPT